MYVMVAVVDVELTKPESAYFDSEDDYRTSCQNACNCQQQQFNSGLRSPGRSHSTYSPRRARYYSRISLRTLKMRGLSGRLRESNLEHSLY